MIGRNNSKRTKNHTSSSRRKVVAHVQLGSHAVGKPQCTRVGHQEEGRRKKCEGNDGRGNTNEDEGDAAKDGSIEDAALRDGRTTALKGLHEGTHGWITLSAAKAVVLD